MAEDKRQLFRSLGFLSSVGISMVAATFIGLAMGYYLDKWLGTDPWLTLVFLMLGIVSGFRNIYILTARELRRQQRSDEKDTDEAGDGQG
jgi:ATP synthase protein I